MCWMSNLRIGGDFGGNLFGCECAEETAGFGWKR